MEMVFVSIHFLLSFSMHYCALYVKCRDEEVCVVCYLFSLPSTWFLGPEGPVRHGI